MHRFRWVWLCFVFKKKKKKRILLVSHASTPRMHVRTLQSNIMQKRKRPFIACLRCIIPTAVVLVVPVNIPLTAPGFGQHKEQRRQQHFDAGINNVIKAAGPRQNTQQCGYSPAATATIADWKTWGCSTSPWRAAISEAWLISRHRLHTKRAVLMEYHQRAAGMPPQQSTLARTLI